MELWWRDYYISKSKENKSEFIQTLTKHPTPQLHWSWAKRLTHYTFLPENKPCRTVGSCWLVSILCPALWTISPGQPCPLASGWIWPMGRTSVRMEGEGGSRKRLSYLLPLLPPSLPWIMRCCAPPRPWLPSVAPFSQVQFSLDSGNCLPSPCCFVLDTRSFITPCWPSLLTSS